MIRSKLLLTIIGLLFPVFLFAQPIVGSVMPVKFDLGLKVGGNFSNLNGSEWENSYQGGFHGGAFVGISRNRFGVQGEVLFSQVKYTGNGVSFYNSIKGNTAVSYNNSADSAKHGSFAVSYLSIPILLNIKLVGPVSFQVGPQFSSLINVKDKDNLLKDAKNVFKSGDVAGVLGLQVAVAGLRVGARYNIGLSDISVSTAANSWKQRTIQLYLGWSFL